MKPVRVLLRLSVWAATLTASLLLTAQVHAPTRVRVSQKVAEVLLVTKVAPQYPDEARAKHIEGSVILETEISPEGSVEDLKVVSGDPLLAAAATDAVKEWKYKPFLLNGKPVAVETQVTVMFTLKAK